MNVKPFNTKVQYKEWFEYEILNIVATVPSVFQFEVNRSIDLL